MRKNYDIVCLSHLRWDFVFQRPQQLLRQFSQGRVFFFEEPVFEANVADPHLHMSTREHTVFVVVPTLPLRLSDQVNAQRAVLATLLDELFEQMSIQHYVRWYYTPNAVAFSNHLPEPLATVYDCMDELSHFKNSASDLKLWEKRLFAMSDLVFTGGASLYEAKKAKHSRTYLFPSSVDVAHFEQTRDCAAEPKDQTNIPHPRVGYFGVLDERLDLSLLDELASARPDLQIVMVGPVCKIDPQSLPQRANLHYLGSKPYEELPSYLAGWQVAIMPFARNDSTLFISPTKTPEYLAGGKPVVSTSIRDVIQPYQTQGLVHIADTAADFAQAIDEAMAEDGQSRQQRADDFLAKNSWKKTWLEMQALIEEFRAAREPALRT